MFRRILVPLDGSLLAESALPVVARIARVSGATITLLRAVSSLEDLTWQAKGMPVNMHQVLEREHTEAGAYLQKIAASEPLLGLDVHIQVVQDHPVHAILYEAQVYNMDAIVMCSHGDTGLKRWMIGSVSRKVVRHSHVPVLLLRPQQSGAVALAQETPPSLRVLVPLDGSPLAEEALAPAIALCRLWSTAIPARLHLASVVPVFSTQAIGIEHDQVVKDAQSYLASVEQRLRQQEDVTNLTITSSVTLDVDVDVSHSVVELAETGKGMEHIKEFTGCDLIAMSTHGRSGLAHWMIGSVMERVLDATKLPMLIVHPKEVQVKQQAERRKSEDSMIVEQSWVGLL
jgi:nucleotide-binding universal stress UspA family protein